MKKKIKLGWSEKAERDLKELRERITEAGFPKTAKSFVSRLRKSANRLRDFPEAGWVVEEFEIPTIREIVFEYYRVIYSYDGVMVAIFTVHHGSRRLRLSNLFGE
jgi:addiction module RelE/StbE family toxin